MAAERTALYRLFDDDESLLYVGISQDPTVRWRQHVGNKPWASQVVMRVIEWYESRSAALLAEIRAIRTEHPLHNIVRYRPRAVPKKRRPASVMAPIPDHAYEAGEMTMADVAVMLGVKTATIRHYRAVSAPGGRYANHPFPEPDGHLGNVPYWFVTSDNKILAWAAGRPGQGAGGGRPARTTASSENVNSKEG